ncbi:MAG: CDP-alcohol phosphatidyltransferase family protein [bacterium]
MTQDINKSRFSEILQPANLVSLSRVAMAPLIGWLLAIDTTAATIGAAVVMILAGVSDALDGYLARRLGQVGGLGIALDPIADKLFASLLMVFLILYRDLPLWLAGAIVGRDLLILVVGALLMRGRKVSLPSNLTGKYAFAAIAVLLASYLVKFPFGITTFTYIALILLAASTWSYARVYLSWRSGSAPKAFNDNPLCYWTRTALSWSISAVYLWRLYCHLF